MSFNIDFWELVFLAEACIPPTPIARGCFWDKLCNEHYEKLSENERKRMFEFLKDKLDLNNEEARFFFARYNPLNQYLVSSFFEGKAGEHHAFMWNSEFHVSKTKIINKEYIKEWKRKIP